MESPIWLADEDVAWVSALGNGSQGEALVDGGGEIFQRVNGEIDLADGERLFYLFDKDALGIERDSVVLRRRDEAGLLHAVAGGANDLDLYGVAVRSQAIRDVIGLPERELRSPGADAYGRHNLLRIRQWTRCMVLE